MRLIDADVLKTQIFEKCNGRGYMWTVIMGLIDKAPVIQPAEPQWIPVAERLPEHYRNEDGTLIPFVVCVRNCKNPVVSYYNGQIWGDMGRMDVVAWAPTPEPYKEENQ